MAMISVVEVLKPYAEFLLPMIFFGFFAVVGITLLLSNRRPGVRKTFVIGFVVVLFMFQVSVVPLSPPPFMVWHKFSDTWDSERVEHEFRVVDASGQELKFDEKSTMAFEGVRMTALHHRMNNEFSEQERIEAARFLLSSAREYRTAVERGDPARGFVWTDGGIRLRYLASFPAHGHVATWTPAQTSQYQEFVGIRLYQMTIVTSEDGSEVVSSSEEMVFEYMEDDPAASANQSSMEAQDVR